MSARMNLVVLAGNLTRDPDLKFTSGNTPVCDFSLAYNEQWKDRSSGEQRKEVSYFECKAFNRLAETINKYLHKGSNVLLQGKMKQERWEAQDGAKRSKVIIQVQDIQFLDGKSGGGSDSSNQGSTQQEFGDEPW